MQSAALVVSGSAGIPFEENSFSARKNEVAIGREPAYAIVHRCQIRGIEHIDVVVAGEIRIERDRHQAALVQIINGYCEEWSGLKNPVLDDAQRTTFFADEQPAVWRKGDLGRPGQSGCVYGLRYPVRQISGFGNR